ncbi:hypothetical protein HanRHA438_Chr15g0697001 [Helianthus annuus]|nr:hypothetical protein HanRHA438_Chr15g0697001 [Helianthus annuus]
MVSLRSSCGLDGCGDGGIGATLTGVSSTEEGAFENKCKDHQMIPGIDIELVLVSNLLNLLYFRY